MKRDKGSAFVLFCFYVRFEPVGQFILSDTNKMWRTSRRDLDYGDRALVMAILNVTPDSFSDGGTIVSVDDALSQADKFISDGADIIDVGGESTRPGSLRVSVDEEMRRVVPVIEAIAKRFDIPISVDTSKAEVAEGAVAAGAEIINDISGLRYDVRIGSVAANAGAGIVLMHSRGDFESMHSQEPATDIMTEVSDGFRVALEKAKNLGIADQSVALDVGIGFGKTPEQNLELLAKLDKLIAEFPDHPFVVGASRKSFIGRILDEPEPARRVTGSVAAGVIAVERGAAIVRVHDVKDTAQAISIVYAIRARN